MPVFEPRKNDYHIIQVLGKCTLHELSTKIHLAVHTPSGSYVAVRITDLDLVAEGFIALQHEFRVLGLMQHHHVLPYHCAFVASSELWVVTPLMDYGSCKDILKTTFPGGMSEPLIAAILQDVLTALGYIHQVGFVHRGVCASHVLVDSSGHCYLAGLHSAVSMVHDGKRLKSLHDFPSNAVKMLPWLAPEVLEQNIAGYSTKSDIYSVGIFACEIANACIPFIDMGPTKMLLEKINGTTPKILDSSTLAGIECPEVVANVQSYCNRTFSPQFHQFVESCLTRDQNKRPSASALLNHPFFRQTKKQTTESIKQLLHPTKPISLPNFTPSAKDEEDGEVSRVLSELAELKVDELWQF